MRRSKALLLSGVLLAGSIALVSISRGQTGAPKFDLGRPGIAIQDGKLYVAVPLSNTGGSTATNVTVNRILLGPATIDKPASFPITLGDIAADKNVLLQLSFSGFADNLLQPLIVIGSFSFNGRTQSFQANLALPAPQPDTGNPETKEAELPPQSTHGAIFPPADHFDVDDANPEDGGFPVPEGRLIGNQQPDNPNVGVPGDHNVTKAEIRPLAPNDPVANVRVGAYQPSTDPNVQYSFVDPSGASVDLVEGETFARLVFLTGNGIYALLSTDGGATFTKLDPSTIFPNNFDGGLCCDQVIQYIPSINRIVWLMQFSPVQLYYPGSTIPMIGPDGKPLKGKNRIRIASASPAQVIADPTNAWTYWDLTSYGTFGLGSGWMDYPDIAFTNKYLHVSIDEVGVGLFVIRMPLAEIRDSLTLHLRYTNPVNGAAAYGGHLAQDSTDAAYWFGPVTTSSLRIFEWLDSSSSSSWRTLDINSWSNNSFGYFTPAPNGVDWLSFGFGQGVVRGATVVQPGQSSGGVTIRTIKIAWNAARGGGFPQPHVRLLDVSRVIFSGGTTGWAVGNESQIWDSAIAFQYPYLATNANHEVGISLAGGGMADWPTPLVGFVGDHVMHYANKSSNAKSRWGDYSAIRKHPNNPKLFSVSDYFLLAPTSGWPKGRLMHQYRLFGRRADVGDTF